MMSGDGLVVRVRPRLGRLTREQTLALCDAARTYGSGIIEVTNRANVQLRGATLETHTSLIAVLDSFGLIDSDVNIEARRNIIVASLWQVGDETMRIADELAARLGELPDLPAKFGFSVDAGPMPVLSDVSADIRLERAACGTLIVRADGATHGNRVAADTAVDQIIAICRWFIATGGEKSRRMTRHLKSLPECAELPVDVPLLAAIGGQPLVVGPVAICPNSPGAIYGVPYGRTNADALSNLLEKTGASALRVTPWRQLVLEDAEWVECNAFICDLSDRRTLIDACSGAPYCASATVDLEGWTGALSEVVSERVHVSGCRKGCAHMGAAPFTVVGAEGRFDIVRNGHAWDAPVQTGLTPQDIVEFFRGR